MSDGGQTLGGVVDLRRVPAAAWVAGRWRELPGPAQAFVALAIVDVLGRLLGLLQPPLSVVGGFPSLLVAGLLPREAVILLPAVIVLRNRDAAVATPLVLRGAVLVAVVEFASATLVTTVGASSLEAWAAISVVSAVATIAGWALIARGLAALLPQEPRPVVAGGANVVLWLLVADALSRLVELFSGPAVDYGIPGADLLTRVASVAGILTSIGWAVVARAIVRGTGYAPDLALRVARVAFAAYAVLIALDLVLRIGALVARALGPASVPFGYSLVAAVPVMSSGWLVPALATCLVVAAFGLGLADPAPRPRGVAPDDLVAPEPPEPAWPTAPQEYLPIHGGGRD